MDRDPLKYVFLGQVFEGDNQMAQYYGPRTSCLLDYIIPTWNGTIITRDGGLATSLWTNHKKYYNVNEKC